MPVKECKRTVLDQLDHVTVSLDQILMYLRRHPLSHELLWSRQQVFELMRDVGLVKENLSKELPDEEKP